MNNGIWLRNFSRSGRSGTLQETPSKDKLALSKPMSRVRCTTPARYATDVGVSNNAFFYINGAKEKESRGLEQVRKAQQANLVAPRIGNEDQAVKGIQD